MAIEAGSTKVTYSGDSSTTVFPVTFVFWDNSDISVILVDSAGDETAQAITTDYTLTGGNGAQGTLTMLTAPSSTETLVIYYGRAAQQDTTFSSTSRYPSEAIQRSVDKLAQQVKQLEEVTTRSLRIPIAESNDTQIDSATSRASKILTFDAVGNPTVSSEFGNYRGDWATATSYVVRDIYRDASTGNVYITEVAHTSSTIASDLGAGNVFLLFNSSDLTTLLEADTTTALSALDMTGSADGKRATVSGRVTAGDGYGGTFRLDTSGTLGASAENGGTIFAATGGTNWYWVREYSGPVNVGWFGALGDGSTNDYTAISTAYSVNGEIIADPGKTFLTDSQIVLGGTVYADFQGSIIKQADGANLDSVVKISATGETPITAKVKVNGNTANNSLGTQTSGTLVDGAVYEITTFVSGDDFTNLGAHNNESGQVFMATGTTPTTYTNGSTLTRLSTGVSIEQCRPTYNDVVVTGEDCDIGILAARNVEFFQINAHAESCTYGFVSTSYGTVTPDQLLINLTAHACTTFFKECGSHKTTGHLRICAEQSNGYAIELGNGWWGAEGIVRGVGKSSGGGGVHVEAGRHSLNLDIVGGSDTNCEWAYYQTGGMTSGNINVIAQFLNGAWVRYSENGLSSARSALLIRIQNTPSNDGSGIGIKVGGDSSDNRLIGFSLLPGSGAVGGGTLSGEEGHALVLTKASNCRLDVDSVAGNLYLSSDALENSINMHVQSAFNAVSNASSNESNHINLFGSCTRDDIDDIHNGSPVKGTTILHDYTDGQGLQFDGDTWAFSSGVICNTNNSNLKAEGTATLVSGNTSITVTHNLGFSVDAGQIQAQPIESLGTASYWWVDTITANAFTININASAGADVDFKWRLVAQ